MNWLIVFILLSVHAQIPGSDAPRTYEFKLQKGKSQFGFLKSQDESQIIIELDDPFLPPGNTLTIKANELVMKAAETPQERENRIDAQLNAQHMVRVTLPDGRWLPVAKSEYALSQRARKMAEAVAEPTFSRDNAPERNRQTQPEPVPEPSPRRKRYIAAGILLLLTVGLMAVILRKMVLF